MWSVRQAGFSSVREVEREREPCFSLINNIGDVRLDCIQSYHFDPFFPSFPFNSCNRRDSCHTLNCPGGNSDSMQSRSGSTLAV